MNKYGFTASEDFFFTLYWLAENTNSLKEISALYNSVLQHWTMSYPLLEYKSHWLHNLHSSTNDMKLSNFCLAKKKKKSFKSYWINILISTIISMQNDINATWKKDTNLPLLSWHHRVAWSLCLVWKHTRNITHQVSSKQNQCLCMILEM